MNYLIDTHVVLWWLDDSPILSKIASEAIRNPKNLIFVSVVSVIEIRIKKRIGKLEGIPENLEKILENSRFSVLIAKGWV